jgi:hypothetical protein
VPSRRSPTGYVNIVRYPVEFVWTNKAEREGVTTYTNSKRPVVASVPVVACGSLPKPVTLMGVVQLTVRDMIKNAKTISLMVYAVIFSCVETAEHVVRDWDVPHHHRRACACSGSCSCSCLLRLVSPALFFLLRLILLLLSPIIPAGRVLRFRLLVFSSLCFLTLLRFGFRP